MPSLNFPTATTVGEQYLDWVWNGVGWDSLQTLPGGLPAGSIIQWGGSTAPVNWLLCDGAAVSRTTYASLFAAVGTSYGTGDGTTTFNLPDLRGRVPVGKNGGSFGTLGATGGAETVTLTEAQMPSHTHTQNSHNHAQDAHAHEVWANSFAGDRRIAMGPLGGDGDKYSIGDSGNDASTTTALLYAKAVTATNQAATATNQNTGGGQAHNNLQPYQVVNYIIKTTAAITPGESELASRVGSLENTRSYENEPVWYDLVLTSPGWTSYNEHTINDEFCAPAYTKIGGIVSLQGLLQAGTTYSANTVIANLPVGYRPDTNMIFTCMEAGTAKNVRVFSNGDVVLGAGFAGSWVSLDNVVFPAAGTATWTNITTFENSWTDYGDAAYGTARYWKDSYGVVWFAGLVRPGSWGGVRVFTLPTDHQSDKIQHHLVANAEGVCVTRIRNDIGGVDIYGGSGTWVSLAGLVGYTASSRTLLSWKYPRTQNGANWGTSYPNVGYAQRPDGLVHMQGLHNPTNGTKVFLLPRSAAKEQKQLRAQVGNDVYCRLDIIGMNNQTAADCNTPAWTSGSGWRSFDGITYAPTPRSFRPKYM